MILDKIEEKAEEVLKQLNIKTLPVSVEDIANGHQIRISRAPSDEFSGMLIRKDGHALIGINNNEAPVRQRFSIAHELGHFFLHPNKDAFVDYRKERKHSGMRTPRERQADMFAAALLMPRQTLLADFRKLAKEGFSEETIETLARRYDVSEDAMRIRLINLNLVGV